MSKWLIRSAIALVAFVVLAGVVLIAYDQWGDAPRAERAANNYKFDEAVQLYDKALSHSIWPSTYRAELTAERGVAQLSIGKTDAALKDLNEALTLDSKLIWALTTRSGIYVEREDWVAARKDLDTAIALEPESRPLLARRAWLSEVRLDFDHANADYDAIGKIQPQK